MDKATKVMFERKIKYSENENLVSIVYEILLCYLRDSLKGDIENNLYRADKCIDALIKSINFDAKPSKELLSIYSFYKTQFMKAKIEKNIDIINDAIPAFEKLLSAQKMCEKQMEEKDYSKYVMYDKRGYLI